MTQEDKELLLKDLCARLPYRVKVSYYGIEEERETWDEIESVTLDGYVDVGQYSLSIEHIKPYLFPMSSMTDEQKREYNNLQCYVPFYYYEYKELIEEIELHPTLESFEYLIKNHFDFRDLIEKGLAIDATGLNIY